MASQVPEISPVRLIVRCFIERKNDQWQGFTLEFGLAVQADTLHEVKRKLESVVQCYVRDAFVGEDRAHAYDLLVRRKATWQVYLRYYLLWIVSRFAKLKSTHCNSLHGGAQCGNKPAAVQDREGKMSGQKSKRKTYAEKQRALDDAVLDLSANGRRGHGERERQND